MSQPCVTCGVRPKWDGRHRCAWCWIATRPITEQVTAADERLQIAQAREGYARRTRVPSSEWPDGYRWCAGCQWFVPDIYVSGTRCKACASRAAHASKIAGRYNISAEQYAALLTWQGGCCYICGKRTKKRLAVDHDHATGAVRGLLCADNEWGCNVALRLVLDDLAAAARLVEYVKLGPLARMLAGEPPREA